MFIQIVGLILIILFILIILIDVVPLLKDWVNRIHIGRYNDKQLWNQSITNKGIKWLNKTPKIKVTDNTRLVIIDILKGNYMKNAIQHWQEAALLLGLTEYLKNNGDEKAQKEITKFLKLKFDHNGQWLNEPKHVDVAILAYAIMKIDFIDIRDYKKALDYTWELIKDHIGIDGTVGYRKSMMDYRYVDTIGFICPFLVLYGLKFDKKECIQLAVKQIKEYERYGMLKKQFIPCHAYNVKDKTPQGIYGWGRGLGWYAIGLIDTWNELPQNHVSKAKLNESVVRLAKSIMSLQQENGSWNWTVTRKEARPDSSVTATLGFFLKFASQIEGISYECHIHKEKALNYLMVITRRNGAVDFSQGDTKDIGAYSMSYNVLPFTQGFAIRCSS